RPTRSRSRSTASMAASATASSCPTREWRTAHQVVENARPRPKDRSRAIDVDRRMPRPFSGQEEQVMPKFMLILGGADLDKRSNSNPGIAPKMLEAYMGWVKSVTDRVPVVSSFKLYDQTGARLTVRGGQVVEGPFVEAKEAVGGLFVIEAASLAEATELARGCPVFELQNGYIEVRAVERG